MIESICADVYRSVWADPNGDALPIGIIARELMGKRPRLTLRIEEDATTVRVRSGWSILVRADASPSWARYRAAKQFAAWWLHRYECRALDLRRLAGAVLAPRAAFLRAVCEIGPYPARLGWMFGMPQAVALLRIGETTSRPVALVRAGGTVDVRGIPNGHRMHRVRFDDDARVGMIAS